MRVLDPASGAAVVLRPAATVLIVRDGPSGLEVLMVRRSLQASFMPGAYVFPGGAVDAADTTAASAAACDESVATITRRIGTITEVGGAAIGYAIAALRECFEECGLWLGASGARPDWSALRAAQRAGVPLHELATSHGLTLSTSVLVPWSHWVTPLGLAKRFDTLFFVAPAPSGQDPEIDAGETTALAWVQPAWALAEQAKGAFPMEFATLRTVESLQPHASLTALMAAATGHMTLPPLHPRLRVDAEGRLNGVLLPGQPGYDEALH